MELRLGGLQSLSSASRQLGRRRHVGLCGRRCFRCRRRAIYGQERRGRQTGRLGRHRGHRLLALQGPGLLRSAGNFRGCRGVVKRVTPSAAQPPRLAPPAATVSTILAAVALQLIVFVRLVPPSTFLIRCVCHAGAFDPGYEIHLLATSGLPGRLGAALRYKRYRSDIQKVLRIPVKIM